MRTASLAAAPALAVTSCGGSSPGVIAHRRRRRRQSPTRRLTDAPNQVAAEAPPPASAPTGPSIRLSDGHSVVAIDPATGGLRARWPEATISLEGDWTVAVADDAALGGSAATWMDPSGVPDRSGAVPERAGADGDERGRPLGGAPGASAAAGQG